MSNTAVSHHPRFDTLVYAEELEKNAGIPTDQARAHARALGRVIDDQLATKMDIERLREDMKGLELRMRIFTGSIMAAGIGIIAVLVKL